MVFLSLFLFSDVKEELRGVQQICSCELGTDAA